MCMDVKSTKRVNNSKIHKISLISISAGVIFFAVIIFIALSWICISCNTTYLYTETCNPIAGFFCGPYTINSNNTLSFAFDQTIFPQLYNVSFACASGPSNLTSNYIIWKGAAMMNRSNDGTLNSGNVIYLNGLQCYKYYNDTVTVVNFTNYLDNSNNNRLHDYFVGNLWIRYNMSNGQGRAVYIERVGGMYI